MFVCKSLLSVLVSSVAEPAHCLISSAQNLSYFGDIV